jgi:hypothetical protein
MNGSSKVCKHAKNQKLFTSCGRKSIVIQVTHDVVRDDVKTVMDRLQTSEEFQDKTSLLTHQLVLIY